MMCQSMSVLERSVRTWLFRKPLGVNASSLGREKRIHEKIRENDARKEGKKERTKKNEDNKSEMMETYGKDLVVSFLCLTRKQNSLGRKQQLPRLNLIASVDIFYFQLTDLYRTSDFVDLNIVDIWLE